MKQKVLLFFAFTLFAFLTSRADSCKDSVLFKKYGMLKIHESTTGVYYGRPADKVLVLQLDSFIATKKDTLFAKFKHRIEGPVIFELYPSLTDIQCLCDWDTLNILKDWNPLGCVHYIKRIQMVLPAVSLKADSTYERWGGFLRCMYHEYVHVMTNDIIGPTRINDIPRWILEGIACYSTKQLHFNKMFKTIIEEKIKEKKVPKFQKLHSLKAFYNVPASYHWSFLFCKFIVDTYGWDKLLAIQEHFESFHDIVDKNNRQINKEWLAYLKQVKPEE